jgi:hypothetical protein
MGLFGEQGEAAEEVAGGSASQADPTPLAPAPFHPKRYRKIDLKIGYRNGSVV